MTLTLAAVHLSLPLQVVIIGAITGTAYALFGMGLTLTYQSARVLNFAQGSMGAVPALFVASRVVDHGWSYWVALPAALLIGAASGMLIEFLLVRRLTHAPRLVVLVATIAVSDLLLIPAQYLVTLSHTKLGSARYPLPFHVTPTLGSVTLTGGDVVALLVAPLLLVGLTLFLRRTNVGMLSRAMAENAEAVELAGVPIRRVSLAVWAIAGLLAAVAGILLGPNQPILGSLFGTAGTGAISNDSGLLVRGLGAAMIGGLVSLPQVFAAGVGLGVVEAAVKWNYPAGGNVELVIVAIVVASLLLRRDLRELARGGETSSWSLAGAVRPLTARVRALPRVRVARAAMLAVALGLALVLPFLAASSQRVLYSAIVLYTMMALSLVVLTGWAGQVSLGQFAFVGVGALIGGRMQGLGYPMFGGLVFGVAAGAIAAVVVGAPALRIRGLFLAVTTLGFAVLTDSYLTQQTWLVLPGAQLRRPNVNGINLNSELTYYYLVLAIAVVAMMIVRRLRQTGAGRRLLAVRDNENMAASLGISPASTKLLAFVVSGVLASLAGYLYGMLLISYGGSVTDPAFSLTIVIMAVVGGATTVTGALLGALYIKGIPYFVHAPVIRLLSTGGGLILAILLLPGGLASLGFRARDWVVRRFLDTAPEPPGAAPAAGDPAEPAQSPGEQAPVGPIRLAPRAPQPPAADAPPALEARSVTVSFGGLRALNDVSVEVAQGSVVGIIGPNGAGKTTLFDVLSGLVTPTAGRVLLGGEDVTRLRPEVRARYGLGRSFQEARLFGDLTVTEVLQVALERHDPSEFVPSMLALPSSLAAERLKTARAAEIIDLLGLGRFAERKASELSTGTRRIVELGCTVALGAEVILLDEPTAGVAHKDAEAVGPLLRMVRDHLDATMVVVAHDLHLLSGLTDHMYALSSGEVIAEGTPGQLLNDPLVRSAYLGSDEPGPAAAPRRRKAKPMAVAT